MFKVGDKIRLKRNIYLGLEASFNKVGIYKSSIYTIANITDWGGIAIEGGWEDRDFRNDLFELAENRKDRINNLYKEQ